MGDVCCAGLGREEGCAESRVADTLIACIVWARRSAIVMRSELLTAAEVDERRRLAVAAGRAASGRDEVMFFVGLAICLNDETGLSRLDD